MTCAIGYRQDLLLDPRLTRAPRMLNLSPILSISSDPSLGRRFSRRAWFFAAAQASPVGQMAKSSQEGKVKTGTQIPGERFAPNKRSDAERYHFLRKRLLSRPLQNPIRGAENYDDINTTRQNEKRK